MFKCVHDDCAELRDYIKKDNIINKKNQHLIQLSVDFCFPTVCTLGAFTRIAVSQKLYFGCISSCWSSNKFLSWFQAFFVVQAVDFRWSLHKCAVPILFFSTDTFNVRFFRLFQLSSFSTCSIFSRYLLLSQSSIKSRPGQVKMNEEVWVEKGGYGNSKGTGFTMSGLGWRVYSDGFRRHWQNALSFLVKLWGRQNKKKGAKL